MKQVLTMLEVSDKREVCAYYKQSEWIFHADNNIPYSTRKSKKEKEKKVWT